MFLSTLTLVVSTQPVKFENVVIRNRPIWQDGNLRITGPSLESTLPYLVATPTANNLTHVWTIDNVSFIHSNVQSVVIKRLCGDVASLP